MRILILAAALGLAACDDGQGEIDLEPNPQVENSTVNQTDETRGKKDKR
jgi:hypothetical protein